MVKAGTKEEYFQIKETGLVKGVKKIIVRIEGLPTCMGGQVVEFARGVKGLVIGFTQDEVLTLVLGDESKVRAEELAYSKTQSFEIPVGDNFIGRVVNPLGEPCDGKGIITPSAFYPIFREAPSTMERGRIEEQLYTGIKIVDSIVPIAKGQKQLIIGDRITGKTSIAATVVLNQKNKDVVCIYCCIGKSSLDLLKVMRLFRDTKAFDYSIVVSATASSSVGEQYLAPYAAAALGEYFMCKGRDVLVIFDDLTKHAWTYREISLLMEKPPGREAYPGDIFYIHSQLLERAGKLSPQLKGGSMTFLPIIETLDGDVTGYIPSNLISMTDGQIYLSSALFSEGFKPAVDLNFSVSTIGSRVQLLALKELSRELRSEYVEYRKLLPLAKLKAGFSKTAALKIRKGEIVSELLIQDKSAPLDIAQMIILFYALKNRFLDDLSDEQEKIFKEKIYDFVFKEIPGLIDEVNKEKKLTEENAGQLNKILAKFFMQYPKKEEEREEEEKVMVPRRRGAGHRER